MTMKSAVPTHDYIFVKPYELENITASGIVLPSVEDPTGNNRSSGFYRVISVGPGPWTDHAEQGAERSFRRRPMCCGVGDVIAFQGRGWWVNIEGDQVGVIQDYQVCAVIQRADKPS